MCLLKITSGEVLWEEDDVSIKPQKCHPTTWPMTSTTTARALLSMVLGLVAGREQVSRFAFGGLILSFKLFGFLSAYSIPLVGLPSSLFLPSSQVSSTLKGMSRCSTYTHLFSFCCHYLCMGPCQFLVLSCSFSFSHEILGKPILGKYGDDTMYIYESVEFNHLFCFATVGNIQCQKYFWVLVLTVYIVSILPRTSLKFFSSSIISGKPKIWLCIGEVKYMTKTRKKRPFFQNEMNLELRELMRRQVAPKTWVYKAFLHEIFLSEFLLQLPRSLKKGCKVKICCPAFLWR